MKRIVLVLMLLAPAHALAVGDASTQFNVYVPPNNALRSRASLLVVTNMAAAPASVRIVDDDADGDDDDSVDVTLREGQSYVLRMASGAVDDDIGGKRDGDYFRVRSDQPVVAEVVTTSNWQHDWAPAEGGGARGTVFFLYSAPTSGADADLDVFAYEDDTRVVVTEISTEATYEGLTSVDLDGGRVVLDATLDQGEDLVVRENGLGLDVLDPGHTYRVVATAPVTVQAGHLGQVTGGNQARDGAGYVPSENGSTSGSLFYFAVPHNPGRASEKEVRVTCVADGTTVTLEGATRESTSWSPIATAEVDAGGHVDFVGATDSAFRDAEIYRLTTDPPWNPCNVFEGNWMETGSYGTSDFATAVSSEGGLNSGHRFIAYVGPPGRQENMAHPLGEASNVEGVSRYASHLYVSAYEDGTHVTVSDVDQDGAVFLHTFTLDAGAYYDVVIDRGPYDALIGAGDRPYFRVESSRPVTVLNGNFNDNWMAYLHSTLPAASEADLAVSRGELGCGETTELVVSCRNPGGRTSSGMTASVTLPEGLVWESGGALAADGRSLSFAPESLPAGGESTFRAVLRHECGDACPAEGLTRLVAECRGEDGASLHSDLSSVGLVLSSAATVSVSRLGALDVPDYESATPAPAVEVSFTLEPGPVATVRLLRATNAPDASAPQSVLMEFVRPSSMSPTTHVFRDTYALHYEATRFYRVEVVSDDGCTSLQGPTAVRTSSGGSGGEDSGLESNGSLATALARRATARSTLAGGAPTLVESVLGVARESLVVGTLASLLPVVGPDRSAPVDVTPHDLLALTNAEDVAAADYVDVRGRRAASALLVETRGEVYDHQKTLCDRAAGGVIDGVETRGYLLAEGGGLLRIALRDPVRSTGEYAIDVKLYEQPDGSFVGYSRWLRHDYPAPDPEQRVLNVQVWSARPGLELALFEDIRAALTVRWDEAAQPPSAHFSRGGVLGGRVQADIVAPRSNGAEVWATFLEEDGSETLTRLPTDDGQIRFERAPFIDVTLDLRDQDGTVMDSMWLSDGAWAPFEDSMWGGGSVLRSFERFDCASAGGSGSEESADAVLVIAGCAEAVGQVDSRFGVARHFGGANAPLLTAPYEGMRVTLDADAPVELCLEGGGVAYCAELPRIDGEHEVVVAFDAFRADGCVPIPEGLTIDLASFSILEPGEHHIRVAGLALLEEAPASVSLACEGVTRSAGCSVSPTTDSPGWRLVFALVPVAWLSWLRRREARG